jgi:hypothetical protein
MLLMFQFGELNIESIDLSFHELGYSDQKGGQKLFKQNLADFELF